jgi:hypothetical protein
MLPRGHPAEDAEDIEKSKEMGKCFLNYLSHSAISVFSAPLWFSPGFVRSESYASISLTLGVGTVYATYSWWREASKFLR